MGRCEEHIKMAEQMAIFTTSQGYYNKEVVEMKESIKILQSQVASLSHKLAWAGGVIGALAALPVVEKVLKILIPAAQAFGG
jgi:hypothetical protein